MRMISGLILLLFASTSALESHAAAMETGDSHFKAGEVVVAQATQPKRRLSEAQSFNVTKFVNTCDAYRHFLSNYPAGEFADRARAWMRQNCKAQSVRNTPAKAIEEEQATEPKPATRSTSRKASKPPSKKSRRALKRQQQKRRNQRKSTKSKKPKVARTKTVKPRTAPARTKKRKVPRCRRETTLECIKRGGEFQFGQCDRLRRCD